MLISEKVEIGHGNKFIAHYFDGMDVDVIFFDRSEYVVDIDKDKAIEIIAFLQKHFKV
jgi:hypothetical protein